MPLRHRPDDLQSKTSSNGVIERFFRTLKEQAIWGRSFRTAAEVRAAVSDFVARYNAAWRLERITWAGRLGMSLGRYREFVMNLPARVILDLLICFVIIALLAA